EEVRPGRRVAVIGLLATIAGSVLLYVVIPKGFFPPEDTGFILAWTEGPTDISFQGMVERQKQVADIILRDPGVDYFNSTVGAGGPNPTNKYARLFLALQPQAERKGSATAIIQRLRKAVNVVPGMNVYFQNVQNINLTGRISKSEYQYTLQSSDTDTLYRVAPQMRDRIAKIEGLRDVNTDLYVTNPQMTIDIDREKAAVYGISIDQVRQELYDAYGNRQVATIYTPNNDYQVILESQKQFQAAPSRLASLYVKAASGQMVPLDSVAQLVPSVGPLQVNHQGAQPAVTISFNLAPGYSLGYAVDAI